MAAAKLIECWAGWRIEMFGPRMNAVYSRGGKQIRLELGPFANEDEAVGLFTGWINDGRVRVYMVNLTPVTASRERELLQGIGASPDSLFWAIYVDGKLAGSLGVHAIDRVHSHGEVGILIGDKSAWGKGVGTAAEAMVLDYAFDNVVAGGLHRLYARVVEGNDASRKVQEKVGFKTIGVMREERWTHGRWWDVWYGDLLQREWRVIRDDVFGAAGIEEFEMYPGCEGLLAPDND